jgi:hypothetical protein
MKRRRLVVVVGAVALIAVGAWLRAPGQLSAEEERLVGLWRTGEATSLYQTLTFTTDRRCLWSFQSPPGAAPASGRCWVRRGTIFVDLETRPIKRTLRSLLGP